MENQLDLDIGNYSIKDIEAFFKFKPTDKYTSADVQQRECELREKLLNSGHINKRFKRDLIQFLTTGKNWLIQVKCPAVAPTSIPKNEPLDRMDVPTGKLPTYSRDGDLIVRPDTQYLHTNNSEYFQGTLNPLSTRVTTKCLTIDTRFRENLYTTQSSDFTVQLPVKISKVVSMQLSSIELPIAFYGISAAYGNNYFYIRSVMQTPSGELDETRQILIPDGNYNAPDLISKINETCSPKNTDGSLINPLSPLSYSRFIFDVSVTGAGTAKVIVEPSMNLIGTITRIDLDFARDVNGNATTNADIRTKLGWSLGFIKSKYEGNPRYVSEMMIEPAPIRYIYLAIDDFNNSVNHHFISAFDKSSLSPNILARIAIKATYFSLIMENNLNIVTEPRKYFGPVDVQKLRIQIFDEYGRLLEMNHSNFSFCLVFKTLYDL